MNATNRIKTPKKIAVVLIGHGSRKAKSNQDFEEYVEAYRKLRPELDVSHGYIELAKPYLGDSLRAAAARADIVVAMPLLLLRSGHAKNDLPLAVQELRREFPNVQFVITDVLGVHPRLAELAYRRAQETELLVEDRMDKTAVVYIGRGSSDPDANGEFYKMSRIFAEGRGFGWLEPCFVGISRPLLKEALDKIVRVRPERVVVVPHFLLTGVLIDRIKNEVETFSKEYPWVRFAMAEPFGVDQLVLDTLDERLRQALAGESALPCDTCKYRAAMPGQEEHEGGLKALLWSVRHTFTHNQAMPAEHAHKPMRKHVLICGNVDCTKNGSIKTLAALRSGLKQRGREKTVEVTRTGCMGHCGEGPTMVVYPDGIWYRGVQADDVEELIEEHLENDRLVARLVDNIMD